MKKRLAIDFEYRKTNHAKYDLVACCFAEYENPKKVYRHWLHQDKEAIGKLKQQILKYRDEGYIFYSFNVSAEARSLMSMGINPVKIKWLDIQAEYKMLLNHDDEYMYGKQLIKGKVTRTIRKKQYEDDNGESSHRPETNLAACTYKLLGEIVDLDQKEKMRKLILESETFTDEDKEKILDYCASDISNLFDLRNAIFQAYRRLPVDMLPLNEEILWRGETVARSALIEAVGYPVNPDKVKNFINNVPNVLKEMQEDINSQFETPLFRFNKKDNKYSIVQKVQHDWIASSEYKDQWPKTPNNKYSLALESWEKFFSYRHDFPRENFPAQVIRFYKLKESLNGFMPKTKNTKATFLDSLDSNGRVHPYLNSYGSQTARYQPKATAFIPLKAAWMRSLIEPKSGRAIAGIDYKSQEFLIAALLSNDKNMIEAYRSGDVYFHFAKLAGAVPKNAKRKDHELVRNRFKSTVLGIQYGMGKVSLANKLTLDTGVKHTPEEAQELINMFEDVFSDFIQYRQNILFDYNTQNYLKLVDGWYLFGDNDNPRSVANCPIQGMGSCILRKAIQVCQDAGLMVIIPLHDALYIEYDVSKKVACLELFISKMRQAFIETVKHDMSSLIEVDVVTWSPDYIAGEELLLEVENKKYNVDVKSVYIDNRAKADYERFRPYFNIAS